MQLNISLRAAACDHRGICFCITLCILFECPWLLTSVTQQILLPNMGSGQEQGDKIS